MVGRGEYAIICLRRKCRDLGLVVDLVVLGAKAVGFGLGHDSIGCGAGDWFSSGFARSPVYDFHEAGAGDFGMGDRRGDDSAGVSAVAGVVA